MFRGFHAAGVRRERGKSGFLALTEYVAYDRGAMVTGDQSRDTIFASLRLGKTQNPGVWAGGYIAADIGLKVLDLDYCSHAAVI